LGTAARYALTSSPFPHVPLTSARRDRARLIVVQLRRAIAGATMCALAAIVPAAPADAAPAAGELPVGPSTHELRIGDATRTYRVYVPAQLPRSPRPIVVVLHGGFGTGAGAARQGSWDAAADAHGFVELAPDGLARSWNAGGCCGPAMRTQADDVGYVLAVLDDVETKLDIDRKRVFASGISNGGMMAYRLGCDASSRFAAIAPVAATVVADPCRPKKPLSLLHIHGLADGNVPFAGGDPTKSFQADPPTYPPVRDGIDTFVHTDACRPKPRVATSGVVVTERWRGCKVGTGVELITIAAAGHSWPGGERMAQILDPPSDALDATETIWRFFAAHPRQ
jgi:polyhydroxybutyrate depolymerase